MKHKWVYSFGVQGTEGHFGLAQQLGNKGAHLAEMCRLGLPVPPGFTMTAQTCSYYLKHNHQFPPSCKEQVAKALARIEEEVGACLGDTQRPLLLSVRSGASVSMPGMMDTILNLGLTEKIVHGLGIQSGNRRFALDVYRRFLQMYGVVVYRIDSKEFEEILDLFRENATLCQTGFSESHLEEIIERFKGVFSLKARNVLENSQEQLWNAVGGVFQSWQNRRAVTYRRLHGISDDLGTGVTVQAMVFGNMGLDSATGTAFTRHPFTGEKGFYGEFLLNAQGEDVNAGICTPRPLTLANRLACDTKELSLEEEMPEVFTYLCQIRDVLEQHYKTVQEIEFTVQKGQVFLLQTRKGKCLFQARLKSVVDMVIDDGFMTCEEGLLQIDLQDFHQMYRPIRDPSLTYQIIGRGLPASPGAVCGFLTFDPQDAVERSKLGQSVILCRKETSPNDIHGIYASQGLLTLRGGMLCHASVVARGMGKVCVVGAHHLKIAPTGDVLLAGEETVYAGEEISLDGHTGDVIKGRVATLAPTLPVAFKTIMSWTKKYSYFEIRASAQTLEDIQMGHCLGMDGIVLYTFDRLYQDKRWREAIRRVVLDEAWDEAERKELWGTLQNREQRYVQTLLGDIQTLLGDMPEGKVALMVCNIPWYKIFTDTEALLLEKDRSRINAIYTQQLTLLLKLIQHQCDLVWEIIVPHLDDLGSKGVDVLRMIDSVVVKEAIQVQYTLGEWSMPDMSSTFGLGIDKVQVITIGNQRFVYFLQWYGMEQLQWCLQWCIENGFHGIISRPEYIPLFRLATAQMRLRTQSV